jgi:PAS domain S-box-containing protein
MSWSATAVSSARLLRIFVLALAVLWTAAVGASLLWGAAAIRQNTSEQLELQTRLARAAGPGSLQGEAGAREALEAAVVRYDRLITAGHAAIWLTGLGFLTVGGRWLLRVEGERDNAEKRLMREHQTLRLLYDHSPDAVAVIDRGRRLLYANRVAESAAGVAPAALHGRICHEAMHAAASPCKECLAEEVFRDGRPAGCVRCERAAEGEERWLWQQWYPVHGVAGDVESVVEIARDVSDLKRTEAELARHAAGLERANRLKELFTDVLSHDLLNPAAASRYFVEQLREGETDPRRVRHYDALAHNLERLV